MRKICGKYESFLAIPLYQLRCYIMYEERLAGSDAILGDFLTQLISAEQSSVEKLIHKQVQVSLVSEMHLLLIRRQMPISGLTIAL